MAAGTNSENGRADYDGGRKSDLAVMDAQEYKQKRRLKRILDARENVEERANDAYAMYTRGEIGTDAKNILILRAVQGYLREIRNLIIDYHTELVEEAEGGADEIVNPYWHDEETELGRIPMETREDIVFRGLGDVLYAEQFYDEAWVEEIASRHGGDVTQERSRTMTLDESVSWDAYMLANEFLAQEKGLDLQFEAMGDAPEAELKYKDILEEGPPE